MRLLCVLITYNRLKYTQRTLNSFLNTIDHPYYLVIVDNHSTDGTVEWLEENGLQDLLIKNPKNFYPGRACNIGWEAGLREFGADFLMRLDNDMELEKGWDRIAMHYFSELPMLGQLGLDTTALDSYNGNPDYLFPKDSKVQVNAWPGNVGGPCIIRRELWDKGLRYDEMPWQDLEFNKATPQEDVKFSLAMHKYGYIYGHPTERIAWTFANESNRDEFPDYYKQTMKERGYQ